MFIAVKARLVEQSGDGARLKIRERELQQEVSIGYCTVCLETLNEHYINMKLN